MACLGQVQTRQYGMHGDKRQTFPVGPIFPEGEVSTAPSKVLTLKLLSLQLLKLGYTVHSPMTTASVRGAPWVQKYITKEGYTFRAMLKPKRREEL